MGRALAFSIGLSGCTFSSFVSTFPRSPVLFPYRHSSCGLPIGHCIEDSQFSKVVINFLSECELHDHYWNDDSTFLQQQCYRLHVGYGSERWMCAFPLP